MLSHSYTSNPEGMADKKTGNEKSFLRISANFCVPFQITFSCFSPFSHSFGMKTRCPHNPCCYRAFEPVRTTFFCSMYAKTGGAVRPNLWHSRKKFRLRTKFFSSADEINFICGANFSALQSYLAPYPCQMHEKCWFSTKAPPARNISPRGFPWKCVTLHPENN